MTEISHAGGYTFTITYTVTDIDLGTMSYDIAFVGKDGKNYSYHGDLNAPDNPTPVTVAGNNEQDPSYAYRGGRNAGFTWSLMNPFFTQTSNVYYKYTANNETLNIKYVDESGKVLLDANGQEITKTVDTKFGPTSLLTNDNIALNGYDFKKVDTDKTSVAITSSTDGSLSSDGSLSYVISIDDPNNAAQSNTLTLVYAAEPATMTINYLDQNGSTLQESKTITTSFGTSYELSNEAVHIAGFSLDTDKNSKDSNFRSDKNNGFYQVNSIEKNGNVLNLYYKANPSAITVNYLLADENGQSTGTNATLPKGTVTTATGVTGGTYSLDTPAVAGYEVVAQDGTDGVKVDADHVTGTYGANADITKPNVVNVLFKAISHSYTATPVDENGDPIPGTQPTPAKGVTGTEITKDDVPVVPGYTVKDKQKVPDGTTANVEYTANDETLTIKYLYSGQSKTAAATEYRIYGKTNESFDVKSPIVTGYVANIESVIGKLSGISENNEYIVLYSADTNEYSIVPEPVVGTSEIGPGPERTQTDSNNPDSPKYPDGVTQSDLIQDSTRTITYMNKLSGTVDHQILQKVKLGRTATLLYDNNGEASVSYSLWNVLSDSTYKDMPEVTTPIKDGYIADLASIPEQTVSDPSSLSAQVTYYAESTTISPKPTDGEQGPVSPGTLVDPDNPNSFAYPTGLTQNDLNKTITKTIHYVDEARNKVAEDQIITVDLERTAMVDFANPDYPVVTYGDWTIVNGEQSEYTIQTPTVDGMTPNQDSVTISIDGDSSDETIVVKYAKDAVINAITGGTKQTTTPKKTGDEQATLPQTDEDDSATAALGVAGMIASMFGLLGIAKKRKREVGLE